MGLLGARQLVVSAGIVITVVALGLALPGGGSSQEAPPALDIAFSFNGGIHAMRPDGSGLRRLTGAPGATDVEPAWSPDGTRLAFVRGTVEAAESGRLYVLESAGGNPRPLTPADGSYVSEPTWSPDGDRIAIARWVRVGQDERESQIVVTDAGGGDEHVVVRERLNERYASVGEPAWSPDGARLAYTRSELDRSYHFRSSLYTVAAGGGQPQLLASEAADAAWSPDGSRIAYSGTRDRNGKSCGSDQCSYNGELYVMDADGANQVRLTRNRG